MLAGREYPDLARLGCSGRSRCWGKVSDRMSADCAHICAAAGKGPSVERSAGKQISASSSERSKPRPSLVSARLPR